MDVEQDDVDPLRRERLGRLVQRGSLQHAVVLELQIDPAQQPQRRVVVDYEHGRTGFEPEVVRFAELEYLFDDRLPVAVGGRERFPASHP